MSYNEILTGVSTRLAYFKAWEPYSINGGELHYSTMVLIPKDDRATMDAIYEAINNATEEGIYKYGKMPEKEELLKIIKDGDVTGGDYSFPGYYCINARSYIKPLIVDRDTNAITDTSQVYSGCFARVILGFYPYNYNGILGIKCSLGDIQKVKDGEKFVSSIHHYQFSKLSDEDRFVSFDDLQLPF